MTTEKSFFKILNIKKSFGGLRVIEDFSMNIDTCEIRALIGPNGAGKTTLFNMISGILEPTSGEVYFANKNVTKMPPEKISAMGLTRTFQVSKLYGEMTVLENVLVGMHVKFDHTLVTNAFRLPCVRKEETTNIQLAKMHLKEVGLNDKWMIPAHELPHGERRLVEIARALASDPKMIMLDEPAAGLNDTETNRLIPLMKNIRSKGIAILLVEHDMKFVMKVSDCITVLHQGRKIAEGKPEKIASNKDVLEAYLGKGISG